MVSLQFTGLSRVFFDTRAGKHQLFGAQPSLCVCVYPLMKVKEESEKASLKLNIQKTKNMASGPITSWQIEGEKVEAVTDFLFLGSKITADGDCSHEIRRQLLLGRKRYDKPRRCV